MCRFFDVSRSGYYDYVKRMDIPAWDLPLAEKIRECLEHSHSTYVCGLGIPLLQLFLLLSIGRVVGVFLVSLIASRQKILFAYILAQTQYGTCNSNSYVLNYYCLWVHFS